ncbi:hypothetical protein N182_24790 [Sinorhizobium sp. GL2]|nr:hypothetical protein N182_24790 [Sinorhizobium sp. GL2]
MTTMTDNILRAWGSIDWVRYQDGKPVLAPDPRQIEQAFKAHGLDALEIGVIGRDSDGNTFLIDRAAAALEAELMRTLMNKALDALGFEEVRS